MIELIMQDYGEDIELKIYNDEAEKVIKNICTSNEAWGNKVNNWFKKYILFRLSKYIRELFKRNGLELYTYLENEDIKITLYIDDDKTQNYNYLLGWVTIKKEDKI